MSGTRWLPWEYGVRNLGRSPGRLLLGIGGSTLVVLLVIAAAAFVRGMGTSLSSSQGDRNVILMGAGSQESVERSEIGAGMGGIAAASIPGIKERLGVPYVSPEIHIATMVRLAADTEEQHYVTFRGIEPAAFLVHANVRIVEGRAPGVGEVIVGKLAAVRMGVDDAALAVGNSIWLDDNEWTISGRFEAPGSVMEAEVWCRISDLRVATTHDALSCVVLTLDETGDVADAELFAQTRLDLELVAMPESDYYGKVKAFYGPVRAMVWITAILVAAGAFFGGLNTLYAAFSARIREIGTLQAIGFSRGAILASLTQEALLTAAAGSLVAAALALLLLDGVAVRISMGAFGLRVDGLVMAVGLATGLVLGVAGALPPAWRCLRQPVAKALKAG